MVDFVVMHVPRSHSSAPPSRCFIALLSLLVVWVLSGCGDYGASDPQVNRAELESALGAYLPRLADTYATGNLTLLEGYAVPKEIATIRKLLGELADQGRIVRPELQQFTLENFKVWNYSNAFATTLEVWDVRTYATGSDVLLSESVGQRNRVKYQLKREGDSWIVLLRSLESSTNL